MNKEQLDQIEKTVLDEFKQKLSNQDGITEFILQMATISAKITKSFIEKYEEERFK